MQAGHSLTSSAYQDQLDIAPLPVELKVKWHHCDRCGNRALKIGPIMARSDGGQGSNLASCSVVEGEHDDEVDADLVLELLALLMMS